MAVRQDGDVYAVSQSMREDGVERMSSGREKKKITQKREDKCI